MKTKSILLVIIIGFVLLEFISILFCESKCNFIAGNAFAYTDGSPAACTGSPADKKTCNSSSCHFGPVRIEQGWITSNIPSSGYECGKTYTIVMKAIGNENSKKFGFQVSPQDSTGKLAGTMIVKDIEQTKLTDKGKYLTQLPDGVEGNTFKSWTFDWKAPSTNVGRIIFYACFIVSGKPENTITSTYEINPLK